MIGVALEPIEVAAELTSRLDRDEVVSITVRNETFGDLMPAILIHLRPRREPGAFLEMVVELGLEGVRLLPHIQNFRATGFYGGQTVEVFA